MRMGHAWLAALATSVLLSASLCAQEPPPAPSPAPAPEPAPQKPAPVSPSKAALAETQVEWVASFPEALRLSRESKKPILVAFNMDQEIANDQMVKDVYRDRKFVEKSRKFVCVIASIGKHDEVATDAGGSECSRFGKVACAEHRDCEIRAREALLGGVDVIAPQHLVTLGDGRILARRAWQMSLEEMNAWLDRALRVANGPAELSPADAKAERARIAAIFEVCERARTWKKAENVQQVFDLDDEVARESLASYVMKGKDDDTRVAIIEKLGVSGEYTSLEVLRKASHDGHAYVALAAIEAMGKTRLPDVKEDLKKALTSFTAGNDYGRVLRAYAACAGDDKSVRELVLKKAKGSDQNVRVHAIVALARMGDSPEIDDFLKKALSDNITNARACAAWAVGIGHHQECRKELERLAATEAVVDLKELALAALAHLDHPPGKKECCKLEGMIHTFVTLGDTRR
jgi:hypothetical protein